MEAIASGFAWSSDRYQLRELVGSGGMSQVYRAWDRQLDREVAIKVLHPHLAASADSRRRFSREARAVAKLHHPHIVEIFDFSGDGDAAYIVTEFIRGTTLQKFSEQVGFGLPQIGALVAHSLCLALEHAHEEGVVHRDLKPENVMLGTDGVLKLMDFGIARFLEQGEKMTMTGAMVGSPAYMAPEVIEGKDAGPKSDLFSLGTLLYWLLTGRLPFDAPNTPALLRKVVDVDYQDPRLLNGQISDALAAVVRSLLAKDPDARPESAEAVRVAIAAALAEDGISDPEASLRAFLADPPGFRHRFRAQLLTRLRGDGERALHEQRTVAALKLADRILALEPGDPDALRLVDAVSAQRRRRQRLVWGLYACGMAALAAGAIAAVREIDRRRPAPQPVPVAEAPSADEPAAPASEVVSRAEPQVAPEPAPVAPARELFSLPASRKTSDSSRLRALPKLAAFKAPKPPAGPPVTVEFVAHPYASVSVDGQPVTVTDRTGRPIVGSRPAGQFTVSAGHHQITLSAGPAYFDKELSVDVGPDFPTIRQNLAPRPAKLRVLSQPIDASVLVDDVPRGSAATSASKPILLELTKPEQTATVRVFKSGYADWMQEVDLRANTETVLRPALKAQGGP